MHLCFSCFTRRYCIDDLFLLKGKLKPTKWFSTEVFTFSKMQTPLVCLLKCCKMTFYVISKYIFTQSKQICNQKRKTLKYFYIFYIWLKYFYIIWIFHSILSILSDHIWSSIFISKSLNFTFSMLIEKQHNAVRNLLRRIQNIRTLWNES